MDAYELKNSRLNVKVANCPEGWYDSSRFDWTGFTVSIVLDGKHEFVGVEDPKAVDQKAQGRGLCTEFRVPHHAPLAKPGENFLKPNVGLLTQKDDGSLDWKFNHRYPVEPAKTEVSPGSDYLLYRSENQEWRGIKLNVVKYYRLVENSIVETVTIDNLGTADFHCMDFNHDFFQIDGLPLGPAYRLEAHAYSEDELKASIQSGDIVVRGGAYTFDGPIKEEARTLIRKFPTSTGIGPVWTLTNTKAGAGIREFIDIPYEEFGIWAVDHVITPKILAPLEVPAKSTVTRTRRWEFFEV